MAESAAPVGAEGSNDVGLAQPQAVDSSVANSQPNAQVDRNAEFEELIKGDYKEVYGKRVEEAVNKRLKNTKAENEQIKAKYDSLTPVLELLGQKYGADASNIEALTQAIMDDDSMWEEEALEAGVPVETIKKIHKLESENKALSQKEQEAKEKAESDRFFANLFEEGEKVKQYYPSFDLNVEMENEEFRRLIFNNVNPKAAYEVIHMNEIAPALMSISAQKAAEQITNNVLANGTRPLENGLNSASASQTVKDVASMSNAQMDDAIYRMQHGEHITFR